MDEVELIEKVALRVGMKSLWQRCSDIVAMIY